jgi:hypothetical protein
MAHQAQQDFCNSVRQLFPDHFRGKTVLDVGSLDINGNNRYLFTDCVPMQACARRPAGVAEKVLG